MSTDMATDSPFRHFNGMVWPAPCEALERLERKLRYREWTDEDGLLAASVVRAYMDLVRTSPNRRNFIVKELQEGPGITE